ncbi:MAG: kynureninase [Rhodobacteraceae bacterium]|nr:kynureninase [Paracoccaceae bacterium]
MDKSFTDRAKALDAQDPLAALRDQFFIPDGMIYFDGNSLGAMPKAALEAVSQATQQEWATDLITSWNKAGWFALPTDYGDRLAPVIGASAGEVVICDSTSINLYKALFAGLSLRPERTVIIAEKSSFPTDLYMVEGALSARPSLEMRLVDDLLSAIDEDVAVVLINHVDYRTGKVAEVEKITARAHELGAVVIWDLCHSAGVLPVGLNAAGADLAIGCTYKYLNGGPGAPAFIYCAARHLPTVTQPLSGWWGHANPFAFDTGFAPDAGIRKFLCGTQPILSFRALEAGLDIISALDMAQVRAKSLSLTALFIDMVEADVPALTLASPRKAEQRGSQVSFTHPDAYPIVQALIERGVVGDFRMPNVLRFGFSPLYLSHMDVVQAANILCGIMAKDVWKADRFKARGAVT